MKETKSAVKIRGVSFGKQMPNSDWPFMWRQKISLRKLLAEKAELLRFVVK